MAHGKIIYKGREIFLFDYTGLRGQTLLESVQAGMKTILDSPEIDVYGNKGQCSKFFRSGACQRISCVVISQYSFR